MISWVISAWRTLFISRVRSSIMSFAFSCALRIAVMRAPCSDAVDSSSALKMVISMKSGMRRPRISPGSGS